METNAAGGPGRGVLAVLGVLVALAIVAVAARGGTSTGESGTRRPADALLDVFFTLYLILLVVGAIFFLYLLALQSGLKRRSGREAVSRLSLLVFGVLLLAGLFAARRLHELELRPPPEEILVPGQGQGLLPAETTTPETVSYEAEFAWIPVLAFVGLLAVGILAFSLASLRRRRVRSRTESVSLGEALADVLEETLDDLRAERDPRRAVIAAYARLERTLGAHGLPRRPADAPAEYLQRVLFDLSVSPDAVRQLTLLFERAKFSQHEVEETMKSEAIGALQTVQDELRAAAALARVEHEQATAAARERVRAAR